MKFRLRARHDSTQKTIGPSEGIQAVSGAFVEEIGTGTDDPNEAGAKRKRS
jgi:hypothetical protein